MKKLAKIIFIIFISLTSLSFATNAWCKKLNKKEEQIVAQHKEDLINKLRESFRNMETNPLYVGGVAFIAFQDGMLELSGMGLFEALMENTEPS